MRKNYHKRKKIFALAKGFQGRGKNCYRIAKPRVHKALQKAFQGRKKKKGDMRRLWIQQINAAAEAHGLGYSRLIFGLNLANVRVNRKMLATLAQTEPRAFATLTTVAKEQLKSTWHAMYRSTQEQGISL